MWNRLFSFVWALFALTGSAVAGDLIRGLTITGGQNTSAMLKLERLHDPVAEDGVITLRVSLSQTRDLKGYGFSLAYDPAKYTFVEGRESDKNLLKTGAGRETLFLASDRTPGRVDIGAVTVDGESASGDGELVEFVFRTNGAPASSDFQVSDAVLIGVDGSVEMLAHVEIGDLKTLPDRFGLDQNAPNPFNPSTVIRYQLAEAGQVRLGIYNLLGQEVRVLVNERQEAGAFTVTWNGTDARDRRVASGVYLYRIQAGAFLAARRMLLLK